MKTSIFLAVFLCVATSVLADPTGARVSREAAERSKDASYLEGKAGGGGTAGTITVTRGEHGYGFIVSAGGSQEHVNSKEAAAAAVEKYKRDGYKYDGSLR